MSSQRMIRREIKRKATVTKMRTRRDELRKQLQDPTLDIEKKFETLAAIQKMPRDSSPTRQSNRCVQTGRVHGVYSRFKLCRNELLRLAMRGELPGVVKSSW